MNNTDKIWFNNFKILFSKKEMSIFFPTKEMTLNKKINAIMRLTIYISLTLAFLKKNYNYLFLPVIIGSLSFVVIKFKTKESFLKNKNNKKITKITKIVKPTKDNPFMNILLNEYEDNPKREAQIKKDLLNNDEIKENIEDNFNKNLYKNVSDVYGGMHSQRQFYTNPVTTIPNNQKAFAEWCFKTKNKSCKEGNGNQCVKNLHELNNILPACG